MEALRLWTHGSAWFSNEQGQKGSLLPGQLADLAVLSADYFAIPEEEIKRLESVLTIVGGKPVYAAAEFSNLSPPPLPVAPEWSPVAYFGGYHNEHPAHATRSAAAAPHCARQRGSSARWNFGACPCWAF